MKTTFKAATILAVALLAASAGVAPAQELSAAPRAVGLNGTAPVRTGPVTAALSKAPKGYAFAVVESDGSLTRGLNVSSVLYLGTGQYEVVSKGDLTNCAWTATIGNSGAGTAFSGYITTALRAGNNKAVYVQTQDTTAATSDRPFHISILC